MALQKSLVVLDDIDIEGQSDGMTVMPDTSEANDDLEDRSEAENESVRGCDPIDPGAGPKEPSANIIDTKLELAKIEAESVEPIVDVLSEEGSNLIPHQISSTPHRHQQLPPQRTVCMASYCTAPFYETHLYRAERGDQCPVPTVSFRAAPQPEQEFVELVHRRLA